MFTASTRVRSVRVDRTGAVLVKRSGCRLKAGTAFGISAPRSSTRIGYVDKQAGREGDVRQEGKHVTCRDSQLLCSPPNSIRRVPEPQTNGGTRPCAVQRVPDAHPKRGREGGDGLVGRRTGGGGPGVRSQTRGGGGPCAVSQAFPLHPREAPTDRGRSARSFVRNVQSVNPCCDTPDADADLRYRHAAQGWP